VREALSKGSEIERERERVKPYHDEQVGLAERRLGEDAHLVVAHPDERLGHGDGRGGDDAALVGVSVLIVCVFESVEKEERKSKSKSKAGQPQNRACCFAA
jgi:hypothetical protein